MTNAIPPAPQDPLAAADSINSALPDDPGQELIPVAQVEPKPSTGEPVQWEAQRQTRVGDTWTLTGDVVGHYRDYVLHADKIVYHQSTSELEAEGHLQVAGGPEDVLINASHGEMRLDAHTARFYNVTGSIGVRRAGRSEVFSTTNPFLFTGRLLLQLGEGQYRIVDGTMTNCRLPKPDWQLIAHSIDVANSKASTTNAAFKVLGVPVFYLPYLRHPIDETGRQSGLLIPVLGNSSVKGVIFGEQVYWAINRSMDMIVGAEYWSKRGWAPNGDFRYKGPDQDHAALRWNALFDRGVLPDPSNPDPANCLAKPTNAGLVNQGGLDITLLGRKDLTPATRLAGNIEYLSCYVYRLVFNDNYQQATNSEVASSLALTHEHKGFVPSLELGRFESYASTNNGDEVRILHLPSLHLDVLDHPLGATPLYWGGSSSLSFLGRSEAHFHARNVGRYDFYPHLTLPLSAGGWNLTAEAALRDTFYSVSQRPDRLGLHFGSTPFFSHESLNRTDFEASVDLRPPTIERDFTLGNWNRQLRHVIEPEFTYHYVTGIGTKAPDVLLVDTTDIATDTNEVGFSLTQRLFLRPLHSKPCAPEEASASGECPAKAREWASWQIAQKLFIDSNFGGAIALPNRRNVFTSTLDLSGIAFLTGPRNIAPVTSRLRFEAIDNLRIQWDLDYDPKAGHLDSNNIFAGYTWGRTTVGIGHALLNAVNESGNTASVVKNQQVQPYFAIGKSSGAGFNFAANGGYDFALDQLQYAGAQSSYNWDCCGLTFGYRRFLLGNLRDETQWLYGFTLANFGSVPGINRSKSVFRDPTLPPAY